MSANTTLTLDGNYKMTYADQVGKLMPDNAILQKRLPFIAKDKQPSNFFNFPVILGFEQGVTYAAADSGAFTLETAKATTMKNGQVLGAQILVRAQCSYEAASRAMKGKKVFMDTMGLLLMSQERTLRKRKEISLLFGKQPLGTVTAYANPVVTLSAADFPPSVWAGMETASVSIYNAALNVLRGSADIVSIDIPNRTITLSADIAGTVATDKIFFKGQFESASLGLLDIVKANSGSLFGIPVSYSLWHAETYSAAAAQLSQAKISSAIVKAIGTGLDGDVDVLVSSATFGNLVSDQSALRRYVEDRSKVKMENGTEAIEFYGETGKVSIVPHPFLPPNVAVGYSPDSLERVGSVDLTFNLPDSERIFLHMQENAGYETRCYSNEALCSVAVGKSFLIDNIVNV